MRPDVPTLKPGDKYLLETVIRTLKMGHLFTQGTADSNEIWLDVTVTRGDRVIGRSGAVDPDRQNEVDPWSHFVNVFMLDKDGNRIDRRNAQDIFTPLYNHQIPPGAGQTRPLRVAVPETGRTGHGGSETAVPQVRPALHGLRGRDGNEKLGLTIRGHEPGKPYHERLPITTLGEDRVTFPVDGCRRTGRETRTRDIPVWQRWNDYGIGLLLKGKAELRQAAEAFTEVENWAAGTAR